VKEVNPRFENLNNYGINLLFFREIIAKFAVKFMPVQNCSVLARRSSTPLLITRYSIASDKHRDGWKIWAGLEFGSAGLPAALDQIGSASEFSTVKLS
jgi:hypothetical protein